MMPKPRVYVHSPLDRHLSPSRIAMKQFLLDEVIAAGFEPQEFNVSGLPAGINWTFETSAHLMDRCQGAIIIALPKYDLGANLLLPSEFAHFEGALALSKGVPTLVVTEQGAPSAGITCLSGGLYINQVPPDDAQTKAATGTGYFDTPAYKGLFESWKSDVRARSTVFFGYCSKAQSAADSIIKYLIKSLDINVVDWAVDFGIGTTIMDEIGSAIRSCRTGLFLFTKDDPLEGDLEHAAPRDNVIFEAGFCMSQHGPQRTIIIREDGAKMPADLGGGIYIRLKDRGDISGIQEKLRTALERSL